jgi:hypothetical protein
VDWILRDLSPKNQYNRWGDDKSFAERTKDKTFDELVHAGKRRAHELIEGQGIAALALYIADIMSKNIELRGLPENLRIK